MLLAVLLASALHAAPGAAPTADSLTGTWQITGDVMGNPLNERCTLAQASTKVTGTCKNTDAADAKAFDVTGEVKDGKVSFSHGGDYQGQALTITYTGALATAKSLKGTVEVMPFGVSGQFTAAPVTASAAPTPATPTKP